MSQSTRENTSFCGPAAVLLTSLFLTVNCSAGYMTSDNRDQGGAGSERASDTATASDTLAASLCDNQSDLKGGTAPQAVAATNLALQDDKCRPLGSGDQIAGYDLIGRLGEGGEKLFEVLVKFIDKEPQALSQALLMQYEIGIIWSFSGFTTGCQDPSKLANKTQAQCRDANPLAQTTARVEVARGGKSSAHTATVGRFSRYDLRDAALQLPLQGYTVTEASLGDTNSRFFIFGGDTRPGLKNSGAVAWQVDASAGRQAKIQAMTATSSTPNLKNPDATMLTSGEVLIYNGEESLGDFFTYESKANAWTLYNYPFDSRELSSVNYVMTASGKYLVGLALYSTGAVKLYFLDVASLSTVVFETPLSIEISSHFTYFGKGRLFTAFGDQVLIPTLMDGNASIHLYGPATDTLQVLNIPAEYRSVVQRFRPAVVAIPDHLKRPGGHIVIWGGVASLNYSTFGGTVSASEGGIYYNTSNAKWGWLPKGGDVTPTARYFTELSFGAAADGVALFVAGCTGIEMGEQFSPSGLGSFATYSQTGATSFNRAGCVPVADNSTAVALVFGSTGPSWVAVPGLATGAGYYAAFSRIAGGFLLALNGGAEWSIYQYRE